MRKLSAILLLSIFVFNCVGYRFVVDYLQQKADTRLVVELDNNFYDEATLIELKVPINLPYQTSWASYERYDGEIEIAGKLYRYVERKVSDDTLYLRCLPNAEKMQLETAKDNYFLHVNDLAQHNQNKGDHSKTLVFKKLIGDCTEIENLFSFSAVSDLHTPHTIMPAPCLLTIAQEMPELPPEDFV